MFDVLTLAESRPATKLTQKEFLLLLTLRNNPVHGYALLQKLDDLRPVGWIAQSGTVYPMLQRLVNDGLVKKRWREGLLTYSLTNFGRNVVREYVAAVKEVRDLIKKLSRA